MKSNTYLRQKLFKFEFDQLFGFDNFMVSDGNQAAYLAAKKACFREEGFDKGLFFYGSQGCGKTHLLQAMGNELAKRNPDTVIKLLPLKLIKDRLRNSSEGEMEFTKLIGDYESAGVLLIDDIEELSSIPSAQEAIFHLYNLFRSSQKLFVATAKKPPSEMTSLSPHLTSRLGWGPVMKIGAPDESVRRKVLENLVREKILTLTDKEIDYILNNFPRDFQTLEGAIEAINNFSLLTRRRVTIPLIKEACLNMGKGKKN